jgi:hypothetical protein
MSKQYRGMCVANNQGLTTLVGLKSKLVLCKPVSQTNALSPNISGEKLVLIPEGSLILKRLALDRHVSVQVDADRAETAQAYYLDEQMGQIRDNGTRKSKLFLAHLHAVTSFCLPDPFTSNTGVEEALDILRSSGVRMIETLSLDEIRILTDISKTAPQRNLSSQAPSTMSTVQWRDELSPLSQHEELYDLAQTILAEASRNSLWDNQINHTVPNLSHSNDALRRHDAIRLSGYRIAGYGAESHDSGLDALYQFRAPKEEAPDPDSDYEDTNEKKKGISDFGKSSAAYDRVSFACTSAVTSKRAMKPKVQFSKGVIKQLVSTGVVQGIQYSSISLDTIRYNRMWLNMDDEKRSQWWCSLHKTLQNNFSKLNTYDIIMWLACMAFKFKNEEKDGLLLALIAIAANSEAREVEIPSATLFRVSLGYKPTEGRLRQYLKASLLTYDSSPYSRHLRFGSISQSKVKFDVEKKDAIERFVTNLLNQWPILEPECPNDIQYGNFIDTQKVMKIVRQKFAQWTQNTEFDKYFNRIHSVLSEMDYCESFNFQDGLHKETYSVRRAVSFLSVNNFFRIPCPFPRPSGAVLGAVFAAQKLLQSVAPRQSISLHQLCATLRNMARLTHEKRYADRYSQSVLRLTNTDQNFQIMDPNGDLEELLTRYYKAQKMHYDSLYSNATKALFTPHPARNSLSSLQATLPSSTHPRPSLKFFLKQLRLLRLDESKHPEWRKYLICLATSFRDLQQTQRLLNCAGSSEALIAELQNIGAHVDNYSGFPDAVLLEIEGNLRMRSVQTEIAKKLQKPPGNKNTVMQLNMGEGKSSVILPVAAASLADGDKLVRVMVAKPQSKQMLDTLIVTLGGIIGRQIYQLPFCRSTKVDAKSLDAIEKTLGDCRARRGVLLIQPEHYLSLQLMTLNRYLANDDTLGKRLFAIRSMIEDNCRDIIDESDENLSPKFELIYTVGEPRPIDYSPGRWLIIQHVLALVSTFSRTLGGKLVGSLECDGALQGSFPRIRFLDEDARKEVTRSVVKHVIEHGLIGLPIHRQDLPFKRAFFNYVTQVSPTEAAIRAVEWSEFWTESTKNIALLLRGLFAGNVLGFAFAQKRWRVNYGLDLTRVPPSRLAVPYRAKDVPTPRAEFSHPDVVIVLTYLSYYYGGLSPSNLIDALTSLTHSGESAAEYERWTSSLSTLPGSLKRLEGVNLHDKKFFEAKLFPNLRYSKEAIDYFLSHHVFPKEMREYPFRLAASGWDLARTKNHPVTGFSGTNDSQSVLPLEMCQLNNPKQEHTNALVLRNILDSGSSVVLLSSLSSDGNIPSSRFLEILASNSNSVRVLIDVGAQIIEYTNEEVAKRWLTSVRDTEGVQAAVYCDGSDEIKVIDRRGCIETFKTSIYSKQLDVCLVFLDEAHARGIDLRLPASYRAAVTLGANLTKDRLVQGM